jgi:hypothetical protein
VGFQKISWEETEKQKARRCRAQEFGPKPCREKMSGRKRLEVIQVVAPQIRIGGYVVNDNAEPDFLEFIRDSANGFISVNLPLKSGTELCVKVS